MASDLIQWAWECARDNLKLSPVYLASAWLLWPELKAGWKSMHEDPHAA